MSSIQPATSLPVVMIVDDVPENLQIMASLLVTDYRVHCANSARRALDLIAQGVSPDLILLDVVMPEMDGYALLTQLKADPSTQDIPVIFLTAMDSILDEEKGLALGAADYIVTPFQPAIVLARVRTQLDLKRARDRLKGQNTYLEVEVARRMEENQLIQDVGIHALAHLAETRDPETGNHIRRTKEYVRVLAEHLAEHQRFAAALTSEAILLLTKSAPLHDIGKVGIPDHVLLKPGKLDAGEWAIMQTHARLGAEAIEQAERDTEKPVAFLSFAKEIARWHHEKWDGSGYPDGLKREQIPISARLMALADVFDALISERVYKSAISYPQARDIIVAHRGIHFDPDVVDAFLESFDEFVAIAARYGEEG